MNDFISPDYDFYSVTAPMDSATARWRWLSGHGADRPQAASGGIVRGDRNAVTLTTNQVQVWRGVDTNFALRARGGLRLSGGTSTGSQYTDNCSIQVDEPDVSCARRRRPSACKIVRPFQTNVRANASYTIP